MTVRSLKGQVVAEVPVDDPLIIAGEVLASRLLLGSGGAAVGNWVFRSLLSMTPVYDAFHFSQLRADGPIGRFTDRAAVKVMFMSPTPIWRPAPRRGRAPRARRSRRHARRL